jgi:repressor LexA
MQNRDSEYLGKLQDYYAKHHVLPSFTVVAELVGLKSTSAVAAMVRRMKAAGILDQGDDRRLQPGKRFFERDLAHSVRAGLPQPSNDTMDQVLSIDDHLIKTPSRTVLLTIPDSSMAEVGLMKGDTVIVEKNAPANPGDIVVAIVDNAYTVKHLARDKQGFYLTPGNKACPSSRPMENLELFGLVVGAFRKY